jgi:hypothetical protein
MYTLNLPHMFVILGLYVDDSILVFNNTLFLNNTKKGLFQAFIICSMWRFFINQDVNNNNGSKQNLLVKHLFNGLGEALMEFLKGNKLHQVMDKFMTLCCPNIRNLAALFKHHLDNKGYIDNILTLKFKSVMITFMIIFFLDRCLQKKCSFSRCL